MLLALVVLGLAATSGYAVLRTVIGRYQTFREDAAASSELAIASAILARDLRSAYVAPDQRETLFVGRPSADEPGSRIDFCQLPNPKEARAAETGYFFKRQLNGEWQLWRRWQESLDADPLSGGRESFVCGSLKIFEVKYFDGNAWTDSWGWDQEHRRPFEGIRGLPLAVSIKLTIVGAKGREVSEHFTVPVMVALLNQGSHG